jgi:hypothetical protein
MAVVIIPSVVIGLLVAASPLRSRSRSHRAPTAAVCFGLGTGLLYGVAALAIKALSGILVHDHGAASIVIGIVSSPYLYVLACCLAVAMLLYQVGLQSCRASILVPVSTVTASPGKLGLRLAAIAVAGLVLITLSRSASARTSDPAGPGPTTAPGPGPATAPGYLADPRRRLWLWRMRCSISSSAPSTSAACSTSQTTRCCTTRGCAGCTGSTATSR